MGVRVLMDEHENGTVLFDSVSGWPVGPVWSDGDEAREFLNWFDERNPTLDLRGMTQVTVEALIGDWRAERDAVPDDAELQALADEHAVDEPPADEL